MDDKKKSLIFIILLIATVGLVGIFIIFSYQKKIELSLQAYFFILIIFALAATIILTKYLNSSAEWTGTFMNGNLKLAGPVVIFLLILIIGYKYRPGLSKDPFTFTIFLLDPKNENPGFLRDTLQITLGDNNLTVPVNNNGEATFKGVDSRYIGQTVRLHAKLDRFQMNNGSDTLVTIPETSPYTFSIPIVPSIDSIIFSGYVFKKDPGKPFLSVSQVLVRFSNYDKDVNTDNTGHFSIYLRARAGDVTPVTVFRKDAILFSDRVILSKSIQILIHE